MEIYVSLFFNFFKIGLFTFGGGYAMLPLILEEVKRHAWMDEDAVINFIAVSESTPGPFAVNMSTYVGYQCGGFPGAVLATLGVVLPSFLVILMISKVLQKFSESTYVKGAMAGLKPAVVGLIGTGIVTTFHSAFSFVNGRNVFTAETIVATLLLCLMLYMGHKKVHPIILIVIGAVAGILVHQF